MNKIDGNILNKIREHNIAYIDPEGYVGTYDRESPLTAEIVNLFRSSKSTFDGRYFGETIELKLEDEKQVREKITRLVEQNNNAKSYKSKSEENEVSANLTKLLAKSLELGASDIHLVNDKSMDICFVNFRIDGVLEPIMDQSYTWAKEILTYISMNKGKRQSYNDEERENFQFENEITETKIKDKKPVSVTRTTNWRFSQMPASRGSKVTIRAVDAAGGSVPKLEDLGLGKGHQELLLDIAYSGQGAVIVSGPTGSGKTTTINSLLTYVPETKMIHCIEDPPEWSLTRRNEVQTKVYEDFIHPKTGEKSKSFYVYGKDILRNDTDVVYNGEIRDKNTASVFLRMSETGQLAFTTIHSNNSISSVSALVQQMGINPNQLAAPGTVKALTHQRLVRKVCPSCGVSYKNAKETNDGHFKARIELVEKLLPNKCDNVFFKNDKENNQCNVCKGKGEKGRTSVFEIIMIDETSRAYIQKMDLNGWLKYLKGIGWKSFQEHAIHKIEVGECDIDSVMQQVDGLFEINSSEMYKDLY